MALVGITPLGMDPAPLEGCHPEARRPDQGREGAKRVRCRLDGPRVRPREGVLDT